jgi:hypothetical protein
MIGTVQGYQLGKLGWVSSGRSHVARRWLAVTSVTNTESSPDILRPQHFSSPILEHLSARGFIHQCTNYGGLDKLLANKKIAVYLGFGK